MKYTELVELGASTPKIQSYLVGSELVTVALRLPRTMRDFAKEYVMLNDLNFILLVKQCLIEKRDRKDSNGANVGYRNGLNLNDDLAIVDSWTKEQIETRTEKLVKLALQAFTFDDIEF